MSDHDKPFACNMPGCGQTFTNNDRLVVHRQTHSLSLKIGRKVDDNITDQTPTPTRFLKNCDEEGLFDELGDNAESSENPFDRDFKSATGSTEKKPQVVSVNTPVPVTCTSTKSSTASNTTIDATSIETAVVSAPPAIHTVVIGTTNSAAELLVQTSQASLQGSKKIPQSPKVSVLVSNNGEIPKAIPAFIAHPGNQVPKAIPAPQVVQLSIPTPAIVVSPTVANNKPSSFIKSAKQKLKETIRYHQSQGKDIRNDMGNIINQAMDEAVSSVKRSQSENNNLSDTNEDMDDKKPIKRSRRSQDDLTPDVKREKFLERNRAAATRCREKRKIWINALEKKAEEMSEQNGQLQNEISCLKHEVAQLKALLLAHRDCPLSLNQQKLNPQLFEQLSESRPIIIDISDHTQQSVEETATTLAQMATLDVETISNGS